MFESSCYDFISACRAMSKDRVSGIVIISFVSRDLIIKLCAGVSCSAPDRDLPGSLTLASSFSSRTVPPELPFLPSALPFLTGGLSELPLRAKGPLVRGRGKEYCVMEAESDPRP